METPKPSRDSISDHDLADMRQEVLRWIDRSKEVRKKLAPAEKKGFSARTRTKKLEPITQLKPPPDADVSPGRAVTQEEFFTVPVPSSIVGAAEKKNATKGPKVEAAPKKTVPTSSLARRTAQKSVAVNLRAQTAPRSAYRTQARRAKRKPSVITISSIAGACGLVLVVCGAYAFGWGRYAPPALMRYVPFPAVYAGDEVLWLGEYYRDIRAFEGWQRASGKAATFEVARQNVLSRFVERVALKRIAHRMSIDVTVQEVERQLSGLSAQAGSVEQFHALVSAQFPGWGIEEFTGKILRPYLIRQATLQQLIAQPGRWKIARQQAEEAVRLIQAGEINFEQAAQKYSRDPAAPVGGDYGYRTLSELPRELQGLISQSTKNQLSAPQRTAEGFYVVSLIERVSGGLTSDDRYHVQMIFVPPIVKFDEIMRVEIEQIHVRRLVP